MHSKIKIQELQRHADDFSELSFSYEKNAGELKIPRAMISKTEEGLLEHEVNQIHAKKMYFYGNSHDGVAEAAVQINSGGVVEVGYYYGDLKPKSIIKVSTQKGCPARCNFCNAGREVYEGNLSALEIYEQVALTLQLVASQGILKTPFKHKINFAGSGEPLLNSKLVQAIDLLAKHKLSFKVSTVFPKSRAAIKNFEELAKFAASYSESIQIQISLISSDDEFRNRIVGIPVLEMKEIVEMGKLWRSFRPIRSQINLSLILTSDTPVNPSLLHQTFLPEDFRIRFRNYIPTEAGTSAQLTTMDDFNLNQIKAKLGAFGYYIGSEARPTDTEFKYSLASNVTRSRMMREYGRDIKMK